MDQKEEKEQEKKTPLSEWLVAAISLVILVAVLGYLTVQSYEPDRPPQVTFAIDAIVPLRDGYLAKLTVHNEGDATLQDLQVEGLLSDQHGAIIERHEARLDFLAARSSGALGMFFEHDPGEYVVRFTPGGYQEP